MFRPLVGFEQRGAPFTSWLEPPRPAITLIVDLEGSIIADGTPLPGAWMAGLGDRYAIVEPSPSYASLDLELTPLGAYRVLGCPVSELGWAGVALEDVFGGGGRELVERVRELPTWEARFDAVEAFLLARADAGPEPSPAVAWACERLRCSEGRVRVGELAAAIGCSRRHLHAMFREQVGVGPKTVARLTRFHAVRRRIECAPARWADIALDAGYADQPHLNREFRRLAGTTPGDFITRLMPDGAVLGDGLPFVQDDAAARG